MNNSTSKKWGGVALTTIMFSALSVFSQTQPNALPTNGKIGIGTAAPVCELDVKGSTSLDGKLTVRDTVVLEKKLIVDQDTRIKGKTIIDGNLNAKSNLKVLGNSRIEGNSKVIGNEIVDGNSKIMGVTKMKGNAFVEGTFKFKGLADPASTEDKWLTINANGKVKVIEKAGLIDLIQYSAYGVDCKIQPGSGTNIPLPMWKSSTNTNFGILSTGVGCPARVGIGIEIPEATFDNRGTTHLLSNVGVGVLPNTSSKLAVRQANPTKNALTVELISTSANMTGVGLQTIVNKNERKAMTVYNSVDATDVFRVMGDGQVWATEVHVRLKQDFPDYVFAADYNLMSISDLETYITSNTHLPNMPTADIVAKDGLSLGEMDRLLVEKVEELTLYIIELNKRIATLEGANVQDLNEK